MPLRRSRCAELGVSQLGACQSWRHAGRRLWAQGPLGRQGWGLLSRGPGVPSPAQADAPGSRARHLPLERGPGLGSWPEPPGPQSTGSSAESASSSRPGSWEPTERGASRAPWPLGLGSRCSEEVWDIPGSPITVISDLCLLQEKGEGGAASKREGASGLQCGRGAGLAWPLPRGSSLWPAPPPATHSPDGSGAQQPMQPVAVAPADLRARGRPRGSDKLVVVERWGC